ncbi:MAG: zinc ribbon domain-containing protein [Planctomycetota bacterium]|nr:zinc ribbon domain-containing protein [Planctomycetota bacterium]
MKLLACPDCSRPYDVVGLETGTALRCVCGGRMKVGIGDPTAGGVTCGHCGAPVPAGEDTCAHCNAALLHSRCHSCGATSPKGSLHCCRCGVGLVCQGLRALPEDSRCPRCQTDLGLRILPAGSAIECPACQGIWLEPDDVGRMTREAAGGAYTGPSPGELPTPAEQPMAYLPCVRCGELMQRRQFRWGDKAIGVVLDHCGDHGVWFDGGELEMVLAHARARGSVGSAPAAPTRPLNMPASASSSASGTTSTASLWSCLVESVVEVFTDSIV